MGRDRARSPERARPSGRESAYEGVPKEKRHIKATYANATPVTDGRYVVAFFGSQGLYAFDMNGKQVWKKDLGVLNAGAYDLPEYEWGTASSPIIYKDLVIVQCDTQNESFVMAADIKTGKTVWKTTRQELPSWGTPTVLRAGARRPPELVTNASNFIRGYDPDTGAERWRLGGSSKITAPTPIFCEGPHHRRERPRARAADLRDQAGRQRRHHAGSRTQPSSSHVVWRKTGRGSYMPTPLIYGGIVYVLGNAGLFDAYDLATGDEIYRQRSSTAAAASAPRRSRPTAASTCPARTATSSSSAAGRSFELLAKNPMGEPLMSTPALAGGTMFVRGEKHLFAISNRRRALV